MFNLGDRRIFCHRLSIYILNIYDNNDIVTIFISNYNTLLLFDSSHFDKPYK